MTEKTTLQSEKRSLQQQQQQQSSSQTKTGKQALDTEERHGTCKYVAVHSIQQSPMPWNQTSRILKTTTTHPTHALSSHFYPHLHASFSLENGLDQVAE